MMHTPRYWAVLPAAGSGSRFGGDIPKQYLMLGSQLVIQHSINQLCRHVPLAACVVSLSAADDFAQTLPYEVPERLRFVTGGAERMDSVLAGLEALSADAAPDDWVLVHDVARPCIHPHTLKTLVDQLKDDPVGGLLAVPVRDTLKRGKNGMVEVTVPRDGLWQCQTPQMFRFGLLLGALRLAKADGALVTDEAAAMERMGHRIRLIEGRSDNIKITYPDDLALALAIMQGQSAEI
jgi:2-C-methyl-D-erythritol 4-phosphate cytidylyltransferase